MQRALSRKNVWEAMPRVARSAAGRILAMVPPRYLLGRAFRHELSFLEDAEWWSAEQAREHALARVRRIVRVAARRSPFYRQVFLEHGFQPEDLRSLDDLARLPMIDKTTVRENLLDMFTGTRGKAGVDYVSTGGTGGEPLGFYIDAARSSIELAHLVASWRRVGYDLGSTLAVFRGRTVAPDEDGLRHEHDPLLRHHYYSNFHMGDDDMRRYLQHFSKLGPCFLHVYPSSAGALARFVRRSGIPRPRNIRGIIAESEIVYEEELAFVEETFECRMLACYGQTEKVVAAAECEDSRGYHVWPTYGHLELIDPDGKPVTAPGARGEIVGTGFINTVIPFIRYRTGDFATLVGERCPACGREQRVIADIEGHRTHERLVAADGSYVSITAINMHDDTFLNVRQYQFMQEEPGRATLRLVPGHGFGDADIDRIKASLERKLAGRLELQLALVGAIQLTRMGKATYVDQRIPAENAAEAKS